MVYSSRFLRLEKPALNGPDVKMLQELLTKVGYPVEPIDGIFGPRTLESLKKFQQNYHLPADGVAGPDTWMKLGTIAPPIITETLDTKQNLPSITIDVDKRKLYYFSATQSLIFPVGVGKPSTPSPLGHWTIVAKALNPGGPFGARWMRLSVPWGGYGIHGTNNPKSIGKAYSHGCIRLLNPDVIKLYDITPIGTPVAIIGRAYTGRVLARGSKGTDAQYLQRSLKTLSYYKSTIDGEFSIKTEKSVKEFQQNAGLTPNGIVDNSTYIALQKALAIKRGEIEP